MKNTITCLTVFILSLAFVAAQCSISCAKKPHWTFGVEASAGLGDMVAKRGNIGFNHYPNSLPENSFRAVANIAYGSGLFVRYRLGDLGIRTGVSYDMRGFSVNNMYYFLRSSPQGSPQIQGRVNFQFSYLTLPLLFDTRLPWITPRLRLLAGGYFSFPQSFNPRANGEEVYYAVNYPYYHINPHDMGVLAGLSYQLPVSASSRLEFKASYLYGTARRYEAYIGGFQYHRVASLSVGWLFSPSTGGRSFSKEKKQQMIQPD